MSFCRWSCLNGYSDVYVYEGRQGYVTHVARKRRPPGAPRSGMDAFYEVMAADGSGEEMAEAYRSADAKRQEWDEAHPLAPIDHPEAGANFCHDDADECAANLERLRREGFVVPEWAIESLREEAAEKSLSE